MLALSAACAHDKPFTRDDFGSDTTRTRGADRQLTYNLGTDLTPGWRQDGSGLLYSTENLGQLDRDRCLGELGPAGGSLRLMLCGTTFNSRDSIDTYYEPAAGPGGDLLFLRETSAFHLAPPNGAALMLARGGDPRTATVVRPYPYAASSGLIHEGITNIRWLTDTRAVYLAQKVQYAAPCRGCALDTLRTGLELVEVDLSTATPTTTVVPNTAEISSVAASDSPDLVYVTRNGDARVYRLSLSTGTLDIVHDFAAEGIARDVHVVGTMLYAVVGGRVSYGNDPSLGNVQRDHAGHIWEVNLTNGSSLRLDVDQRWFRRPAASPAGDRLVAEAFLTVVSSCAPPIGCIDTTISRSADLWLFDLP